jgi:hypothetical protein
MGKIKVNDRLILPAWGWSMSDSIAPDGSVARNILRDPKMRRHFLPIQSGGATGTNEAADVVQQTIDGVDTRVLWQAYQQAVELKNRERQPLVDFISRRVNVAFEGLPTGSGGARFERASERGVPRSYRPNTELAWMAYDFAWRDLASRFTWEFLVDATAEQINAQANMALEADNTLLFEEIMWTLFSNVNRDVSIETRPYVVYSFYNGTDGVTPPDYKTNTFTNTHTHYLVSGAATINPGNAGTSTPGDLEDIITHMEHHGYTRANGADIVIMMNKTEGDVVRNWRSVANGGVSLYDFIPAQGTPTFLLPVNFRTPDGGNAVQPAPTLRGMTVIGSYGPATIVQEDYIPSGYVVGFATGGPDAAQNPVGLREHANPAFRGLRLVKGRDPDYPLQEAIYQRGFGTGIRFRGAGVIMKIAAAGSYSPPAEYADQPL